jgi:hypothetical protein
MSLTAPAHLSPIEVEKLYVGPFVRQHFPYIPRDIRPEVAAVRPERVLIAGKTGGRLSALPAQYSYTYVHEEGLLRQVVYVLADAQGTIMRVLTSK